MKTNYRDNGAIGALLDEYEKAIYELKEVIKELSENKLCKLMDTETKDDNCRSIQSILNHVISAGYNYIIVCRNHHGENIEYSKKESHSQISKYLIELDKMFYYNLQFFDDYPNINLNENDVNKKIPVSWGNHYDVEQLMEHAIVHILRHRRQISRFLIK